MIDSNDIAPNKLGGYIVHNFIWNFGIVFQSW